MPWVLFAAAVAGLLVAFKTTSVGLLVVSLLLSFLLAMVGVVQLLAQRVASRTRNEATMIDPVALAQLRRQAQMASAQSTPPPSA